jgi:uncharacterized protein (DUF1499 family)
MKHLMKQLAVLAAIGGGIWIVTAWPRISEVETGRTPEYPDLRPHDYGAGVEAVVKAVKDATARLPRWEIVGIGKGPVGSEIQAVKSLPLIPPLKYDVSIRVHHEGGRSRVTVRSRSRTGPWDFGQNARNVRELLDALDREVF